MVRIPSLLSHVPWPDIPQLLNHIHGDDRQHIGQSSSQNPCADFLLLYPSLPALNLVFPPDSVLQVSPIITLPTF